MLCYRYYVIIIIIIIICLLNKSDKMFKFVQVKYYYDRIK